MAGEPPGPEQIEALVHPTPFEALPGARRLELFSRASRPGWDAWGLETGKFDPVTTIFSPSNEDAKSVEPLPEPAE